jgi:hypothetical protein
MKSLLILPLSLAICACGTSLGPSIVTPNGSPTQDKLGFLPKQAERGILFSHYQVRGQSEWKGNWASNLNLTGVSWNDSRTATLIAPKYVVMAGHYTRPPSVPVMFHDKSGKPYERFIAKTRTLNTVGDIAVAQLNLPLPPEVKAYRFAKAGDATVGRPVIVTDQTNTLSVHQIAAVSGNTVQLAYIPGINPAYGRNLIVGDSGNPSFLLVNGELVLLETHTTGGPGAGPFYGSPQVQAAIRSAIAEMER